MERRREGIGNCEGLPKILPKHLVFIPDGNRRSAAERHKPAIEGHRRGVTAVKDLMLCAQNWGIETMTVWGFSTENWERGEREVRNLMMLFGKFLDANLEEINQRGARFRWLGNREDGKISRRLKKKLEGAEELTLGNSKYNFNIALNYSSRDEIVRAMKKIVDLGLSSEQIKWSSIAMMLDTAGLPDPDLIIRTGEREDEGDTRHTSGLFALQGPYARWYFTPTLCPDFSQDELKKALWEFSKASPRLGK